MANPAAGMESVGRVAAPKGGDAELGDYLRLLKPRVMSLSIFTAFVGLAVAPHAPHPVIAFASLLCVAVGAGASGALNMWWDADIDRHMERTRRRPIPSGRVEAGEALTLGLVLAILSVVMLAVFANPLAAGLLAFTIFFYVVIYSMWLKRSTPQNIVIGGAAGAFPPMVGWAVSTGAVSVESLLMFLVIFLWTPPHFWALALWRRPDYAAAGVPMMPVTAGEPKTRRLIWIYSLVLAASSFALALSIVGGPLSLIAAVLLNGRFLMDARRVAKRSTAESEADRYGAEKRLFGFSLAYLFAIFAILLIEAALRAVWAWPTIGALAS